MSDCDFHPDSRYCLTHGKRRPCAAEEGWCAEHGSERPCWHCGEPQPPKEFPDEIVIQLDRAHVLCYEGSGDGRGGRRYVCRDDNCGVEAWIEWRKR